MTSRKTIGPTAAGDARERIVLAASKVFAAKGYGQASTREICKLAEVNVASIHYYFGDKASLYRELFTIPEQAVQLPTELDDPTTSLIDGLSAFYQHVMGFVLASESSSQLRLLFLREQVEPSGLLEPDRVGIIGLYHAQLVRFLSLHLELETADSGVHQLAFTLLGMAMVFYVERATVQRLTPGLIGSQHEVDETVIRLVSHASGAVNAERERRQEEPK